MNFVSTDIRYISDKDLYEKIEEEFEGACGTYDSYTEAAQDFERMVDDTKGIDFNNILNSLNEEISFAYKKSKDSPHTDFYAGYVKGIKFTIATMKKILETNNLKEVD